MKNTYVLISALILSLAWSLKTSAQQAIYGTPDKYQGYLVMNNISNPSVEKWQVQIFEKYLDEDSIVQSRLIEQTKFNEPYLKIDPRYYNTPNIYIVVSGMDGSGKIAVTETYTPLPNEIGLTDHYYPIAYSGCEYPTYAIQIVIDEHYTASGQETGGSMMEMWGWASEEDTTDNYGNVFNLPRYQYMSNYQFGLMKASYSNGQNQASNIFSLRHHGFNHSAALKLLNPNYGPDGISCVVLPNPTGSAFQDYNGANINENPVYAVQKALGPFTAAYYPLESPHLAPDGESLAGQLGTFNGYALYANQYIIDTLNAQYQGVVLPHIVGCPGESESGEDGSDAGEHCGEQMSEYIANNPSYDAYDLFFGVMEIGCLDEVEWETDPLGGDEGGTPTWPHPVVSYFQIYSVANPKDSTGKIPSGGLINQIFRDSIFNQDGSINLPPFTLKKGLYNMVLGFNDHSTLPILFEVAKTTTSQYDLSNLLTSTVFPVPFKGEFTTKMQALATIKFTYSVYDESNKIYFKRNFFLKKDQVDEIRINAENFKKGLIFHKFVFEDGSEKIISTIKE